MIADQRHRNTSERTGLEVALDRPLPGSMPTGQPTAVFCIGTCFHRERRISELTITVNAARHRPIAQRMPRRDRPYYRSGFWAVVPVGPCERPGRLELGLEARLADGTVERAPLGAIAIVERPEPPAYEGLSTGGDTPLIAICMATYNPDLQLFRAQVESIRAQSDQAWVCLISDDCSTPERFEAIAEIVAGDERFVLSRAEEHVSFYRNFERALGMVPADAQLVALCDHDDRWYPDKLSALRESLGAADLAYSDLRRVDVAGRVRSASLWEGRRNNYTNLASLLISNTIPGAACLFRRRVIEHALPFPDGPGWDFHDHWLALVAMSLGTVAYVDRQLYDYVQHPGAVLGRVASDDRSSPDAARPRRRGDAFRRWRSVYFSLYLQRVLLAETLLVRCAAELTPHKRRALRLVAAAGRSPLAFAWLAVRPARALFRRNETLQLEAVLARGILWRHLIGLRTWRRQRPSRPELDAKMPPVDPGTLGPRQRRWLARRR